MSLQPSHRPPPPLRGHSRRSLLRFLCALLFGLLGLAPVTARADLHSDEYIIVSGGPALREWEDLRANGFQHDRYWGNFIRTARIRMEQLRQQYGDAIRITWLVYKPSYVTREQEDTARRVSEFACDIENIQSVRDKFNAKLVWFFSGRDVVDYLNRGMNRSRHKVSGFEFFGHSNRHCFMFDYSSEIIGVSTAYLHEDDLGQIRRGIFTPNAHVQSYGCHTGESMSEKWRRATGVSMVGAVGKTDYSESWKGTLPHINQGHWKR